MFQVIGMMFLRYEDGVIFPNRIPDDICKFFMLAVPRLALGVRLCRVMVATDDVYHVLASLWFP
jgi:hypothetical protein